MLAFSMEAEENEHLPIDKWTESDVEVWLKSIGIAEKYIQKIQDEEVNGQILLTVNEAFLERKIGMKSGPAHLIITKRDEKIKSARVQKTDVCKKEPKNPKVQAETPDHLQEVHPNISTKQSNSDSTKRDCKHRPFEKEGTDFAYAKGNVLQPESGVVDLITPCHEYKSFATAATLDCTRLQAKLANEILRFACGCINMRSNGTIHFGVMDSRNDSGYVHGEIAGIHVKEKDMYSDALDYIERCFSKSECVLVRECIRPPQFVEVADRDNAEKRYVVEVDIVPKISIVKNKVFAVRLPKFKESSNKVELEKKSIYCRVGSKTEPVQDPDEFYCQVKHRDEQRENAENVMSTQDVSEDLGRKLTLLITDGKKSIDKERWHILVTNRFQKNSLSYIDFLVNLRIFSVFDFDPDSRQSGLCSEYQKHHAVNLHFLKSYKGLNNMDMKEFETSLRLFEQASWIFCNGRTDFRGKDQETEACDEMTWIRTKKTLLKEVVSGICKKILPKGTFMVIFLLTSQVELPIVHTFYEFFAEMQGHEDIICISESEENFTKWAGFAAMSCSVETVHSRSVAGMKLSHVNATIQQLQPSTSKDPRHLPVFSKALCQLETVQEERMSSLEILCVDQCETDLKQAGENSEAKISETEKHFYRGGKVNWLNFWLSDKKYVGEIIQRDACKDICKLLSCTPRWGQNQIPVNHIKVYHQPGSGGTTIARQVLWNNRKDLRCAVVKPSFSFSTVADHAVKLREYEEKDIQKCLPVLLLVDDFETEYVEELRKELIVAMKAKKINPGTLCFVLLSCQQSHDPQKMFKESPLQNFSVTHKLSPEEKLEFAGKVDELKKQYSVEFIITFVLMTEEFERDYIVKFVKDLLKGINHLSVVTRLIKYVALFNTYMPNSYISQSHCEALLMLTIQMNTENQERRRKQSGRFDRHLFESSLNEQARILFIHLRDEKTHIKCIRIIHPLIAEELLLQLLDSEQSQSELTMELLCEDVLFENNFGKEDYHKFLRHLCMRRNKISKGDKSDTSFSPLIEHVLKDEPEKDRAVDVLKAAYVRFGDDAFFAQQLARLYYTLERFEEARDWAEIAAKKMPSNSFILDTRAHVYKRWFNAKNKLVDSGNITPENTVDAIATAIQAMECFRACEKAANLEQDTLNISGYFSEVDLECDLLKLIFKVFPSGQRGYSECVQYLVTDYIPTPVRKPWENLHTSLKYIHRYMHEALERISEDLSYFQTGGNEEEDEFQNVEIRIKNPINWLANKTSWYGKTFRDVKLPSSSDTLLTTRMKICSLGGGNITSIFSHLSERKQQQLEHIVAVYKEQEQKLDQTDLANYIASQIALSCISATSCSPSKLPELQRLSQKFPRDRNKCQPNALFLITLLFWPEDDDPDRDRDEKYEIVMTAIEFLKRSYSIKRKNVSPKEQRIFTHFFLGNGRGLNKIVHKSKMEALSNLTGSQKRMKWWSGDVWKMTEVTSRLKCVQGWTEDGSVFLQCSRGKKIKVHALNYHSLPDGNENVEFYLGFTFQGLVATGVTVCST